MITLLIEAGYVIALLDDPVGRPDEPDVDQPFASIAPVTALGGVILGGLGVLSFVFWFGSAYGGPGRAERQAPARGPQKLSGRLTGGRRGGN